MNQNFKIPIFDLKVRDKIIVNKLTRAFKKMLSHGQFFLGPEITELENKIAKIIDTKYAVGVASGSSALFLALKASGIKPGDEVITSPMTWIITINAIAECGAIPVFADINNDYNISVESIKERITKKTKAIVPVHYAGKLCEMEKISNIANENNILIIEDAAQAFGASKNGVKAGKYSKAAAFSFNPMKTLGGYGEAGMVVTDDEDVYKRVQLLKHAGTLPIPNKFITNNCVEISLNHKMDTINASLLLVALDMLALKMEKRQSIANEYNKNLPEIINFQQTFNNETHARYVYPIITDNRDNLKLYLEKNGIETKIMHKPLACDAEVYKKYNKHLLPNSYKLIDQNLIIPSHEGLSKKDVQYVIECFKSFN
jgi:dTDP-4-amino-4,6-dideoxygalactose transaminase